MEKGFKRKVIHTIADMLIEKSDSYVPTSSCAYCKAMSFYGTQKYQAHMHGKIPKFLKFYLVDSPKQDYLGIMLERDNIPYIIRKSGMYGLILETGLCKPVGKINKDKWGILQVHIVTTEDEILGKVTNSNIRDFDD